MPTELTAAQHRARQRSFVQHCGWSELQTCVPLAWPTPPSIPPSPKRHYRSAYVYRGAADLADPSAWKTLSEFDLLLRLIDFSGLRPVLAQHLGWVSARGQVPFDPVSCFLLQGWQLTSGWTRAATLHHLAEDRYADYALRLGFTPGVFPTEGGMRHFLTALGQHAQAIPVTVEADAHLEVGWQTLNALIVQSVQLLRTAGLLSRAAWEQAVICPDGMLHAAASRLRCTAVTTTCYQATTPATPRPCPAKDKPHQGCNCDTLACATVCQHAPARDPEARCIVYTGSNQPKESPNRPTDGTPAKRRGKLTYGYRSFPLELCDAERRFSVILSDDFRPANEREELPIAAELRQLASHYPTLHVDTVAGDAGFGYDLILHGVYAELHARRVIDLRAHETDRDKLGWPTRGYDDRGRPLCPFGYAFTANGWDPHRQRYKWMCGHACQHGATPKVLLPDTVYPPPECPYQGAAHPHGEVRNVAEAFADGSTRLVRDVPFGTPTWKEYYHRARNAVEGRNAIMQGWGLKRLSVYGLARGKATLFQADVWLNLTTLARLIREATLAVPVT